MGLASVISNGVQAPLKLHVKVFSSSPLHKSNRVHFLQSHLPLLSCKKGCWSHRVLCTRGTEQQDDLSTSESESNCFQEREDVGASQSTANTNKLEEKINKGHHSYGSSVTTVALCVLTAVAFGIGIGLYEGVGKASEYFAGYILEQSLSVDNLFVFVLVFKYFKVPLEYQNRVLSYGIAGAIIFRLSLILLGTATLQRFEVVNLFLAGILLYSSFKLFASEEDDSDLSENFIVKTCQRFIPVTSYYDGNRFFTNQNGIWKATPLLLTVAVIELSDIAFAVDSIPAVFGVTRDPFIVFSSNLFAILGLRSLYTLISEGMADLEYLQLSAFCCCSILTSFHSSLKLIRHTFLLVPSPPLLLFLASLGLK